MCYLREVQESAAAVDILTRPALGGLFHPPTHRLLCNRFSRRRALYPGGDGETHLSEGPLPNDPFKLACFVFPQRVDSALPAICEGCSTLALRSPLGDGETQCSKVHSCDARNGPSLRSQAVGAYCILALA